VVLYCSIRYAIYLYGFTWIEQDTIVNIPRVICLILALWYGLKVWGRDKLGFHFQGIRLALAAGSFVLITGIIFIFQRSIEFTLTGGELALLTISTAFVAVFEETQFRGVLLNAIRDWRGASAAIWISSLIFTLFHIQAQPFRSWPMIFIFGVLFALLRVHGVSLLWLIGIHFSYLLLDFYITISGPFKLPLFYYLWILTWLCGTGIFYLCLTMRKYRSRCEGTG